MAGEFEIEDIGFAVAEVDALTLDLDGPASQDKADTFEVAAGPAVSQAGDLWLLGEHRLLCGSALDPATYRTLMGQDKASAVFTDPPYNAPISTTSIRWVWERWAFPFSSPHARFWACSVRSGRPLAPLWDSSSPLSLRH